MDVAEASRNARRALARFRPDRSFALHSLTPAGRRRPSWVFRCEDPATGARLICKTGPHSAAGRRRIAAQFGRLRAVHAQMPGPHESVPTPLGHDDDACAFFMSDCDGESLRGRLSALETGAQVAPLMARAGRWLAGFHAPGARIAAFAPDPHLDWLRRKHAAKTAQGQGIADPAAFGRQFAKLEAAAPALAGRPVRRCITHRDFHLGNILLTADGRSFGIDFENDREDIALRDVMSFLFEFVIRWDRRHPEDSAGRDTAVDAFLSAYGDSATDPRVARWFQSLAALSAWAGLGDPAGFTLDRAGKAISLQRLAARPLLR